MQRILTFILTLLIVQAAYSQTAKRYVTLEHFTNTLCSVCANNNPALFNNLDSNPGEVHHISIHSEIPYTSCIYYQHNTTGNNYRKDLYGNIFGTPTTITNGTTKGTGAANLLPQSTIDNNRYATSPLRIQVSETISGNMLNITVRVKTYRPIVNPNLKLFVAIAEKYIMYNAPNGESDHQNVFRTMLPANEGESISPAPVGQEVVKNYSVMLDGAWDASEIYAYAFVQDVSTLEIINSGTKFDLILEHAVTPEDSANVGNGAIDLMVSGGTQPYTYNWSTGATTSMINNLNNGDYTVTVTDAAGFEYIDTVRVSDEPFTGINDPVEEILFTAYPNPAKDKLTIEVGESGNWLIMDLSGAVVSDASLQQGVNTIDISHLPPGLYFHQCLFDEGKSIVQKLLVAKQ